MSLAGYILILSVLEALFSTEPICRLPSYFETIYLLRKNMERRRLTWLQHCNALGKCGQQLISQVFKKDTPSKYQVGAVLRPIPMLIFLNFIKM